MARPGVTYDEVVATAEQLGDEATVDKIRLSLARGSQSTISKHLRQWRSLGKPRSDAPSKTLQASVDSLFAQIKAEARIELEKALEQHQIDSREQAGKLVSAEKELREAKAEAGKVARQLKTAKETKDNFELQLKTANATIVEQTNELKISAGKIASLKNEVKSKLAEISRLSEYLTNQETRHTKAIEKIEANKQRDSKKNEQALKDLNNTLSKSIESKNNLVRQLATTKVQTKKRSRSLKKKRTKADA